jgi:hypothetical protein
MTNFFPTFRQKWVVFYSTDRMRERHFDNETEANEFSATVKGSVCPYTEKILPSLTSAQSRKLNNELKRIKKFGY